MTLNRKALSGTALVVIAVLFVAVMLLVNVAFRGARVDLTQNHLYTLSDGTKKIVGSLDEPINLYLYFSDKGTQDLPQLRTYYTRVREMLEEIASRSGGKVKLELVDPLPFSEDEDRAASFGLQSVPVGNAGEKVFFGLAGTNSTNGQSTIPFFNPEKESFLEYDVAKLIHELSVAKKPVVGILSDLPIASGFDPATRQMREPWAVDQQWSQLFDMKPLQASTLKSVDKDIDVLVVVHPKQLSDDAQYAIDQFVLRGGHLLAFVDPDAELDDSGADPQNPMAAMMAETMTMFSDWRRCRSRSASRRRSSSRPALISARMAAICWRPRCSPSIAWGARAFARRHGEAVGGVCCDASVAAVYPAAAQFRQPCGDLCGIECL